MAVKFQPGSPTRSALPATLSLLCFGLPWIASPALSQVSPAELAGYSLEQLLNIEVTSVSRRSESLSGASASLFVITAEDVRRSGASSLPEVLRLAPNLQVARRAGYEYSISARGFNNTVGNKLLVLIDGRVVYTPLFSGVFWEMQDTLLEDIERIEVISGPGATLWGANAVNGVINIITRPAAQTQGLLLSAQGGNFERGVSARGGWALGASGHLRVYGKAQDWDHTLRADGSRVPDAFDRQQLGFRADWGNADEQFSLQGDAFQGKSQHRGFAGPFEITPVEVSGSNLLARWNKTVSADSDFMLQAYWSRNERNEFILFSPRSDLIDVEFQQHWRRADHELVWGGGVTHATDRVDPSFFSTFLPRERELNWEHVFVQDEITLTDDLSLTPGIKLEWNDYTGLEHMPSLRLSWQPSAEHMVWSAYSRAIRAPSRLDRDVYFPDRPPFIVAGGPDFVSEVAYVSELGYRGQPHENLNLNVTLFNHDWDKLRSGTPLPLPTYLVNDIRGAVYGVEAWATWQPSSRWRLQAGINSLKKDLRFRHGTQDNAGVDNHTLHNDPAHQWKLRASISLPANLELDLHLRGVAALHGAPEQVPGYVELDVWLGWQLSPRLELSLSGRNLLDQAHPEFGALSSRGENPRSLLMRVQWEP